MVFYKIGALEVRRWIDIIHDMGTVLTATLFSAFMSLQRQDRLALSNAMELVDWPKYRMSPASVRPRMYSELKMDSEHKPRTYLFIN